MVAGGSPQQERKMRISLLKGLAAMGICGILGGALCGAAVTPAEMAEARRWAAAKFKGVEEKEGELAVGLQVLANLNAVQPNLRNGKPLRIGDKEYTRGLYCHAVSKVVVRLPGPGQTFTAIVGVDSNDQTRPGRGSIIFSASVGAKGAYKSELMRESMPGVPVKVELGGAEEFLLEVSEGGDGIACDQADWADAKVTLTDGQEIWLGDMSIAQAYRKPYGVDPFFSFIYDGRRSSEFLGNWSVERSVKDLDAHRTGHTLTYRDPKTRLTVRCVGVAWQRYPTVEWTLYFKNEGDADTPILESIQGLDAAFVRGPDGEFVLHHNVGDTCSIDSFAPLQTVLGPNTSKRFVPAGGRPTNAEWPYYNLECPQEREGVIIVIGWPGQWAARFDRDGGTGLRVAGGQELTRFKLHPGEEIRTPLIVLQFYKGDPMRAQNIWRRWMFDHNFPSDHGKPLSPRLGAASVQFHGFNCTQAGDLEFIDRFLEKGVPMTDWWMDAGWYKNDGAGWPKVGTWEVDDKRFPDGIKAISDRCHANGIELIVWFEVERVHPDTWIAKNHPEWVHGGSGGGLLKMDDPAVVRWLTDHIDKIICKEGIDLYRSDFNIDPLPCWRGNDAEDRQGITEIRYIEGYLSYWDELRRRHPGMLIDSCASGGRRDDLETMRRAVPLLRTDFEAHPEGNQSHTYGFAPWLPYFDAVHNWSESSYNFRSCMAPFVQRNWDVRKKDFNWDKAKRFVEEWRSVADDYFGDFYPLGEYSTSSGVWMAWQFDRPRPSLAGGRAGAPAGGLIQAFRRPDCPYVSAQYKLRSLEPAARYIVSDLDTGQERQMTGRDLMEDGLLITIPERPGAALLTYKRAGD
jgi:alpha-galactosidase